MRELTQKQKGVLKTLMDNHSYSHTPDDEKMDLDELIEQVPYEVTKQALQFTLRSLRKRGYIQKSDDTQMRRGRLRVLWFVSEHGEKLLRTD